MGQARRRDPRHCRCGRASSFPSSPAKRLALHTKPNVARSYHANIGRRRPDRRLHQIGDACPSSGRRGHLSSARRRLIGQSLYLREICWSERKGAPPPVRPSWAERMNGDLVRTLIAEGCRSAVHDVSGRRAYPSNREIGYGAGLHRAELDRPPTRAPFWSARIRGVTFYGRTGGAETVMARTRARAWCPRGSSA